MEFTPKAIQKLREVFRECPGALGVRLVASKCSCACECRVETVCMGDDVDFDDVAQFAELKIYTDPVSRIRFEGFVLSYRTEPMNSYFVLISKNAKV